MLASYLFLATAVYFSEGTSYNYTEGGKNWPGLCKNGSNQSPIPITYKRSVLAPYSAGLISIDYAMAYPTGTWSSAGLNFTETFGTIEYTVLEDYFSGTIDQILFYSPSQHTINGKHYDMEITLISNTLPGNDYIAYATSVFLQSSSKDNVFIDQVLNVANKVRNQNVTLDYLFDDPEISTFYQYEGSLTYPPCEETVSWHIIPKVYHIGKTQLAKFTSQWAGNEDFANKHGNNRNLKWIKERVITLYREY